MSERNRNKQYLIQIFMKSKNENGFSMLEAVVVVGVLLALAIGGFFAYGSITENAKKAKVRSAASEVYTGVLVANSDGDPNTKPSNVKTDWNNSAGVIQVDILDPITGESFSDPDSVPAGSDFCVTARNTESPHITARFGACSAIPVNPGGGNTDGGNPGSTKSGVMLTKWDTSLRPGCQVITLPINQGNEPTDGIDIDVDWGDGTPLESFTTSLPSHTYTTSGPVAIKINGTFDTWGNVGMHQPTWGSSKCLVSVDQWSDTKTHNLIGAFDDADNLKNVAEVPETVNDLSRAFQNVDSDFTIGEFNTPYLMKTDLMFSAVTKFNQPVTLDTVNVTSMHGMFQYAKVFNSPVNFTDTSKVQNMRWMFTSTDKFNQPLDFNTSNVTDMNGMFQLAKEFNQPLTSFDTSKLENMGAMFRDSDEFNQPLNFFNTSNVMIMDEVFMNAKKFDQDISLWDTGSVSKYSNFSLNSLLAQSPEKLPDFPN